MTSAIESVLVVDDSEVQRQHAVRLCRDAGIGVVYEARDGLEALELLRLLVLPPSLMVVDLEMPGMDGVQLLDQLRRRTLDIPVVISSSRDAALLQCTESMGREFGLRVAGTMQKPVAAEDLHRILRAVHLLESPPTARAQQREQRWRVEDLHAAIHEGRLEVHYQPKVDVRTGHLHGAEALARWTHPAAGRIPPDVFVRAAEEHGLILPLTLDVMAKAMRQAAEWKRAGLHLQVAVNVSPLVLDAPDLVREVCALADAHEVPPSSFTLEITESGVVSRLAEATAALVRLRLRGFGLSIDDFGTGFSSIQQLARVPFTELKIDRSFVNGAHHRRTLRVILKSALDMSRQLALASVAEGVETMADWRLLQELGCTTAQGYLVARPMPAAELPRWLAGHGARLPMLRGRREERAGQAA